jgi:hypothetical protein
MSPRAARAPRRRAGHVKRPRPPLRRRIGAVLPRPGRLLAVLLLAVLGAGLVVLVNGPWLRVARVAWAGQHYTAPLELQRATSRLRGDRLLTMDLAALRAELQRLPAVSEASVEAQLPDTVTITLTEKVPAFIWQTSVVRLIGAADGTLIGQLAVADALPDELATLPLVDDQRAASHSMAVGGRIDAAVLATALRLVALDPARLGSKATGFGLSLDDEHGFVLVARGAPWQAALGNDRVDPAEDPSHSADLIEAQLAGIRTLLAMQPEDQVSWIDVRNPGKVYWRP